MLGLNRLLEYRYRKGGGKDREEAELAAPESPTRDDG
jgi:hypothetical protein